MVAPRRDDRRLEPQLRRVLADPRDTGRDAGGAMVHGDARAAVDRGQLLELDVEAIRAGECARGHERIASVELAPLDSG